MWPFSSSNTAVIAAKRQQQVQALEGSANANAALDGDQGQYLKATAPEIVSRIQSGEWTASRVLEAYIARAAFAHSKTNCLTEVFFDRARERAKELDAYFAETGKLKGPLHGVPISIKDQFKIEGLDGSIGFSNWLNQPATSNADIIKYLLDAGAVLYVKTNVPQTMFAFECSNPVFGRTTNPYNDAYTCGGSSGGEGALIALDGSPLGIGTDIGGSLRIPATYCGIYSLKPGYGRISYFGARGPVPGFDGIRTVAGPMGRSVEDLVLLSRTVFGLPGTANDIPPVPFKDVTLPAKLKFGYYTSDGYIKASPTCKRAVLETVEALRKQGHECVEVELPDISEACNIFVGLTSSDGYKTMLSNLGPDKKEPALFLVTLGPKLPSFVRGFAAWVLETFMGDKTFSDTIRSARVKGVDEYWALSAARDAFALKFQEQVLNKYQVDGIIAPVQALPQLPHGGCDNFSALAIGTILYNVLDLPVGCLPATRVDPAKDQITKEWESEPGHGSTVFEKGIYYGKKKLYDPESAKGMPVNIQIAGRKWEDEKVLAMMKVVDEALGKERGFGPGAYDKWAGGESQ
ncbi:amidase [Coprinopsis cinerea okayama7|uniref:amidase n=1 Tax=Coprinopsis cinerea (strain Okayama-7 / 130 / ATCC MYA-4618 / FGSC 9003) TaxID=240176 RepID=A8N9J8_COPC7|nr:amidase [Coprinopsis cinerea okayama7\|eukprot:XP_001831504.1 amidase [Coprinopsis cinerea okayama7\